MTTRAIAFAFTLSIVCSCGGGSAPVELPDNPKRATLVVEGDVVAVRDISPPPTGIPSEHDPDFNEAQVNIRRTFKGNAIDVVRVRFAASEDVLNRDFPKLKTGQQSV